MTWTIPQIYVAFFLITCAAGEMYLATGRGIANFLFDVICLAISYGAAVYFLHVGGFW